MPPTRSGAHITGAAETDVIIRITRRIIQIQRERAGVRGIIPIAATDETQ